MAAHKFWRVNILESSSTSYAYVRELELATAPGGANVATGGVASADSFLSATYAPSKAFDGNAGTYWSPSVGGFPGSAGLYGAYTGNAYIQYELPTAMDIAEVRITAHTAAFPMRGVVSWSDDGVKWTMQAFWGQATVVAGSVQTVDTTLPAHSVAGNTIERFRRISFNPPITGVTGHVLRTNTIVRREGFTRPMRYRNWGGAYHIAGSTTVLGVPKARRVLLIDQRGGYAVIAERYTTADGLFSFEQLDLRPYTVIGIDPSTEQNSVIFANVLPVI